MLFYLFWRMVFRYPLPIIQKPYILKNMLEILNQHLITNITFYLLQYVSISFFNLVVFFILKRTSKPFTSDWTFSDRYSSRETFFFSFSCYSGCSLLFSILFVKVFCKIPGLKFIKLKLLKCLD